MSSADASAVAYDATSDASRGRASSNASAGPAASKISRAFAGSIATPRRVSPAASGPGPAPSGRKNKSDAARFSWLSFSFTSSPDKRSGSASFEKPFAPRIEWALSNAGRSRTARTKNVYARARVAFSFAADPEEPDEASGMLETLRAATRMTRAAGCVAASKTRAVISRLGVTSIRVATRATRKRSDGGAGSGGS